MNRIKSILINRKNSTKIKYLREQGMKIGNGCTFYCRTNAFSTEPYLIEIGNKVTITSDCQLLTHDGGCRVALNMGLMGKIDKFGRIIIKDNVFIGIKSIIMPNVTIGNNCIICAGSIVTKDIPDNSVAVGVPAKVICTVEEWFNKNKDSFSQTRGLSPEEKKKYLIEKYNLK